MLEPSTAPCRRSRASRARSAPRNTPGSGRAFAASAHHYEDAEVDAALTHHRATNHTAQATCRSSILTHATHASARRGGEELPWRKPLLWRASTAIQDSLALPNERPSSYLVCCRSGFSAQGFHADATEAHQQQRRHRSIGCTRGVCSSRGVANRWHAFWIGSHHGDVQAHVRRSTTRGGRLRRVRSARGARVPSRRDNLTASSIAVCRMRGTSCFNTRGAPPPVGQVPPTWQRRLRARCMTAASP